MFDSAKENNKNELATVVRELKVLNKFGMHARPAALFVKTAKSFDSDITVEKDGVTVSAKSIMGLLTIEGYQGAVLKVVARGSDAEKAVNALQTLIDKKFYEE